VALTVEEKGRLAMYRNLFDRLPDEIVLDMATRDLDMESHNACVCGWALRLALQNGAAAEDITLTDSLDWNRPIHPFVVEHAGPDVRWHACAVPAALAVKVGGSPEEWQELFAGVLEAAEMPLIELAFVDCVATLCK